MTDQPEEEVPSDVEDLDASFSSASEHIVLTVTDPQPGEPENPEEPGEPQS